MLRDIWCRSFDDVHTNISGTWNLLRGMVLTKSSIWNLPHALSKHFFSVNNLVPRDTCVQPDSTSSELFSTQTHLGFKSTIHDLHSSSKQVDRADTMGFCHTNLNTNIAPSAHFYPCVTANFGIWLGFPCFRDKYPVTVLATLPVVGSSNRPSIILVRKLSVPSSESASRT